ncbi:putative repressor of malE transcription [Streptomyces sp. Tu6071]|nr:putative repressor of malE transcription [Streptomyces sp. Tu6071]
MCEPVRGGWPPPAAPSRRPGERESNSAAAVAKDLAARICKKPSRRPERQFTASTCGVLSRCGPGASGLARLVQESSGPCQSAPERESSEGPSGTRDLGSAVHRGRASRGDPMTQQYGRKPATARRAGARPEPQGTARLADLAAQAGVSEATVSRVLNGKPGVADATGVRGGGGHSRG